MEQTTQELIRKFKRGTQREEAFQQIFTRHYAAVYSFFLRRGCSPEAGHELARETFLAVYSGLDELPRAERFLNWLYHIVLIVRRNEAVRHAPNTSAAGGLPGGGVDPVAAANRREAQEELRAVLMELPPHIRRCAYLRLVHNLPDQQIALTMGVSVDTVEVYRKQARRHLQATIGGRFGPLEL